MTEKFVTDTECTLRTKNIEQSLKRIENSIDERCSRIESAVAAVATDLKEFKDDLNPVFSTTKQQLESHIKQERQDKQRRKERWSSFQIALLVILATATGGMFIVALIGLLHKAGG